jgi:monothiol glutaredoxin
MALSDELKSKIDGMVHAKRIVVFMKGSAMMPACGFSASALATLKAAGANPKEIATHDVLRDPDLRQGIKDYSSWPTIPQVFIDGKLIGGSDIVRELHERGELAPLVAGTPG